MSIVTMPQALQVSGCQIGQRRYDIAESSDATGHYAVRLFGPPRWSMSLRSAASLKLADAALWEAMLLSLRGGVNHLLAFDPMRVNPRGTYRGTITLSGAHSAGAVSVSLVGGTGTQTLLAGDWLQIGTGLGTSQLVKVVADATASAGAITATIEPPLRTAFGNGTAVAWDRPSAYFRMVGSPTWDLSPRRSGGYAADLIEVWG